MLSRYFVKFGRMAEDKRAATEGGEEEEGGRCAEQPGARKQIIKQIITITKQKRESATLGQKEGCCQLAGGRGQHIRGGWDGGRRLLRPKNSDEEPGSKIGLPKKPWTQQQVLALSGEKKPVRGASDWLMVAALHCGVPLWWGRKAAKPPTVSSSTRAFTESTESIFC